MTVDWICREIDRCCFIGAGVVGGIFSAAVASNVPGVRVTVVDKNAATIDAWNSTSLPVVEPGLPDLVEKSRHNLHFSTDIDKGIEEADIIFLCVNTPPKGCGAGSDLQLDTSNVEEVVRNIAAVARSNKIVVDKSTVPVGAAEKLRSILRTNGSPGVHFEVLSNPEFLVTGRAIDTAMHPDRVLIGSSESMAGVQATEALANLYKHWIPHQRILTVNSWSAELTKLAANAMLAQRVSSVNALSAICEKTGAKIKEVSLAVGADDRIGLSMLRTSFGFGGSCFWKDIRCLIYLCRSLHLEAEADLWQAILQVNEAQERRAINRITSVFGNTGLEGKRIACLGFAFKENTGDTRLSVAIRIIQALLSYGAKLCVYDPFTSETQIRAALNKTDRMAVEIYVTAYAACENADAVVVTNECEEFRTRPSKSPEDKDILAFHDKCAKDSNGVNQYSKPVMLDWEKVASNMKWPRAIFGSSQFLDGPLLRSWGFYTELLGDSAT